MRSSPYREAAEWFDEDNSTEPAHDTDLIPVFVMLWIASVVRVAVGLVWHETFGLEPTMAVLTVLFLPVLGRDALGRLMSRGKRSRMRCP